MSDDWRLSGDDDDDASGSSDVCTHHFTIVNGLWFILIFLKGLHVKLVCHLFLYFIFLSCKIHNKKVIEDLNKWVIGPSQQSCVCEASSRVLKLIERSLGVRSMCEHFE